MIPYEITENIAVFGLITMNQYKELLRMDRKGEGLSKNLYRKKIMNYAKENNSEMITVILLNNFKYNYKFCVRIFLHYKKKKFIFDF